jgi:ketosteroid isomerase-like protein
MSQENVDFIRGIVSAAGTMDKETLLAALPEVIAQICDPEIEWVEDPTRADGRVYRGHDGVRESWERWLENFDEYGAEIEALEDHGERVFMAAREHGRGSASSADVSSSIFVIYTFRDGKVLRYQEFYDERDARAALEA